MKKGILAIALSALMATSAMAAPKITATAASANPLALLQNFTVADLQAALKDAQSNSDTAAVNCYTAILAVVQSGVANPLPTAPGVFGALQKARDAKALLANLQSPTGPLSSLNIACAPLVLDAQTTLLAMGVTVGLVANPVGGAAALAGLPAGVAAFLALPKL